MCCAGVCCGCPSGAGQGTGMLGFCSMCSGAGPEMGAPAIAAGFEGYGWEG